MKIRIELCLTWQHLRTRQEHIKTIPDKRTKAKYNNNLKTTGSYDKSTEAVVFGNL